MTPDMEATCQKVIMPLSNAPLLVGKWEIIINDTVYTLRNFTSRPLNNPLFWLANPYLAPARIEFALSWKIKHTVHYTTGVSM